MILIILLLAIIAFIGVLIIVWYVVQDDIKTRHNINEYTAYTKEE